MSRLRKLELDRTRADLASVSALIDQLTDEDIMMRSGLESRRNELLASIGALNEVDEHTASAALFFGGRPVAGARGIESEFAGSMVTKFQDLVTKLFAQETGNLGQRGVVPNKAATTLHITNLARGSLGFVFEEIEPQEEFVDSALKIAVDKASRLLDAFAEPDEEIFRETIETVDERALAAARDFFVLMRQAGATLRLVAGEQDNSFGAEAVARAADRAASTVLEDAEETLMGQLAGVLPDAHQFEFRTATARGTIRGRVDRSISAIELAAFNRTWVNVDAKARFRIKRILRNGEVVRESFTMLSLDGA